MPWELPNPNITNSSAYLEPRLSNDEANISSNAASLADIATDVKQNGAKGDGTTDDSSAIQTVINNSTNKKVFLPNGRYRITSPIVVNDFMKIEGQSRDGTIILIDSTTDIDAFQLWQGCEISNLTIQINNPNHTHTAFRYYAKVTTSNGNYNGKIHNIVVNGTGYSNQTKAIEFDYDPNANNYNAYAFFWTFRDFYVNQCFTAWYTQADFTKVWTTACTFENFILTSCIRAVYFNTTYIQGYYSRYDFINWQFQSNNYENSLFYAPSDRSIVDIHLWDPISNPTYVPFYIKGTSKNNKFIFRNVTAISNYVQVEKPLAYFANTFELSDDPAFAKNIIFNTTINIDPVNGNDSTGDGSTTAPYKTIANVLSLLPRKLTANVTIQLVDGTYSEGITLPVFYGSGTLTIQGTTATGTKVNFISMSNNQVVTTFKNMTVQNTSGGIAILAADSRLTYFYTVHVVPNGVIPTYGYYIQSTNALIRNTPQITGCTNAVFVTSTSYVRIDSVTGSGNTNGFVSSSGMISYTAAIPVGFATTLTTMSNGGLVNSISTGFGNASIAASGTSIVVNHGLSSTPTFINVTPQGNVGNVWVDTITSTQFTIHCSSAPVAATVVSWHARV